MKNILRNINIYDKISIGFLVLILIFLLWEPLLTTSQFQDFTTHLLSAENIERSGGIVNWSFWKSLPHGQAQVYPPLFQLILSFFVKLGLSPFLIVKSATIIFVMLILALGWFGIKLLFGSRVALFFLLLNTSFSAYFLALSIVIPASIVLALSPLLLYLIQNKKIVGAVCLLTIMFYTHMIMPWFLIGALIVWSIFNREQIKTLIISASAAIVLYLPWLIHLLINNQYIKYLQPDFIQRNVIEDINFNLSFVLLFVVLLAYLIWHWRKQFKKDILFFLLILLSQVPLLFYLFPNRFMRSGGFFAIIVVTAFVFDLLIKKNNSRTTVIVISLLILIFNIGYFELAISPSRQTLRGYWDSSIIPLTIQLRNDPQRLAQRQNQTFTPANRRLAQTISQNSEPNQVIFNVATKLTRIDNPSILINNAAQFFAAISNRAMVNPPLPDYFNQPLLSPLQAAIVIAQTKDLEPTPNSTINLSYILNTEFEIIAQEDRVVVLKNKNPETFRITPAKAIINQWLALLIFLTLSAGVVIETKTAKHLG